MSDTFAPGESSEPTAAELAEIEREWPLIEAEISLLDAEIRVLYADGEPTSFDVDRLRLAHARVTREAAAFSRSPRLFRNALLMGMSRSGKSMYGSADLGDDLDGPQPVAA